MKNYLLWDKMAQMPLFYLIFLGLSWPWAGEFDGFIIMFTCFPTQQNSVYRKHPSILRFSSFSKSQAVTVTDGYRHAPAARVSKRHFFFFFSGLFWFLSLRPVLVFRRGFGGDARRWRRALKERRLSPLPRATARCWPWTCRARCTDGGATRTRY